MSWAFYKNEIHTIIGKSVLNPIDIHSLLIAVG